MASLARSMMAPLPARPAPVRVLFVVRDMAYHGGVPRCVLAFCQGHDPRRVTPVVASFAEPSAEMAAALGAAGIEFHFIGDRGRVAPALALRRLVRWANPDVLVGCSLKAYVASKCAAGPRPVIFWIHSIPLVMDGWMKKAIFNQLSRKDPLVFVSQAARARHRSPKHSGPEAVVYNGVADVSATDAAAAAEIAAALRTSLGIPAAVPIIGYVAEFVRWKDHETLLRAMDRLASHPARPHLVLIGTGELFEEMRASAGRLASADRVHFMGPRPDARRLLHGIDVYASPTWAEAFGLAAVEAMLAGKPVVAAGSGAFVEYITHGTTGLLFEPHDAAALAAGVASILDDPALAARLGAAGRRVCLDHFSPSTYVDELTRFFTAATSGGRFGFPQRPTPAAREMALANG